MSSSGFSDAPKLFRQPDVAKLIVAYLITYTGTAMAPIAMAFGVLELTGSTRDSAIVIAAPAIASVGVLLISGVLADRTSRQRMIVLAEGLAMVVQLLIAHQFLSNTATVPVLTALMLALGVAMALNVPASAGLVIQIVNRDQFQTVNALLGTARNGAMLVGAALAGILVAAFGAGVTLAIDAASFGVSALLVMSLRPRLQARPERASVVQDLRLGWREFRSHTWLWVIVLQFSLLVAVMESVFGLLGPAVALEHLNGARDWGFIAASFGGGTLLGGVLALRVRPRYPMRFATLCTFTFLGVPLALSVPLSLSLIAAAAFVEGVAGQLFAVLWYTTLQQRIPPHLLSRVSAYDHLGSIVLAPLGVVVAGFSFELIGYRATLLIASLTILLPCMAAFSVRDVRMMTSSE
ncbi:MAG: MFS transporter [Deltaproteobacteria bacterium]|nr:MFS transporter [Deltaproteobacteria bacterium]